MDLLQSLKYPDEVLALVRFMLGYCEAVTPKCDLKTMRPSLRKCYGHLIQTSVSFSAVTQALDDEIRDSVCIFYLVLRALDTIEDDMTIPNDVKIPMLKNFYKHLQDPTWCYMDSKEKHRRVLEDFPSITKEFHQLSETCQKVISDICHKMGVGMCVFMERNVETLEEWNEYCHYVGGLTGIGLAGLVSASGLEEESVGSELELANRFGLFLQRTNIIRDYLEDSQEGREFWPKQVWGKYAHRLKDFANPSNRQAGIHCLNELITETLELIPDCICLTSKLQNKSIFRFCAIPQMVAIGSLERCYNNPNVFTGVVKIRKGEAVKMIMGSNSIEKVKAIVSHYTNKILTRIPPSDPNSDRTKTLCLKVLDVCQTDEEYSTFSITPFFYLSCGLIVAAITYRYWNRYPLFTSR